MRDSVGLCRVLEDETPDVVEHAAVSLRMETERRHAITAHHAVFLRFATRAIARGVTAKAREALDAHFSGPVLESLIKNPTPPKLKTVFLGRQRLDIKRS